MKNIKFYIIGLILMALGSLAVVMNLNEKVVADTETLGTSFGVSNQSPVFTVTPSDGGSDTTAPTNAGGSVPFTATAKDINTDQYYLAICKTDAVSAGNDTAPTCTGGSWAISSATNSDVQATTSYTTSSGDVESNSWYSFICDKVSGGGACYPANSNGDTGRALGTITFSGVPEDGDTITVDSVTYEFDTANNGIGGGTEVDTAISASSADAAAQLVAVEAGTSSHMVQRGAVVYVYADTAGVGGNSIAMSEPNANEGGSTSEITLSGPTLALATATGSSPFYVNHAPTFGTVTVTDTSNGEINPGDSLRFTLASANIADADTTGTQDTIDMYICATAGFTYGASPACTGTEICNDTGVNPTTTDATCDEVGNTLVPPTDTGGSEDFYVYIQDSHNFQGTGTNLQSYTIANTAPTHDNPELDVHAATLPNSVAYLQFEDGDGATSFDDETSNGSDGTCTVCPTWTAEGYSGGAYDFSAGSSYISGTTSEALSGEFTLSAWAKFGTSSANYEGVLAIGNGVARQGAYIGRMTNGNIGGGFWGVNKDTGVTPTLGQWYHIVQTWDGTTVKIYVDGTEEYSGAESSINITNSAFSVGRILSSYYLVGTVDEPHVYNRALTADEIAQQYAAYAGAPEDNLVSYFSMDEAELGLELTSADTSLWSDIEGMWHLNGDYNDSSGNANNGSCTNCPDSSSGVFDTAYGFNGLDDYVDISDSGSLRPVDRLTLSAWVYIEDANNTQYIIRKWLSSNGAIGSYTMYLTSSEQIGCGLHNASLAQFPGWKTGSLSINKWHHVVCAYNKENFDSTDMVIYVDSEVESTTFTQNDYNSSFSIEYSGQPLRIGKKLDDSGEYFEGKIDEVSIWGRTLDTTEIAELYNRGILHDAVGANDGQLVGAQRTTGKYGDALDFDGNDYIDTGVTLDNSQPFSLSGWAKVDDKSVQQGFFGAVTDSPTWRRVYIGLRSGNYWIGLGDTQRYVVSADAITDGVWFHWALTADGSDFAYYVNGNSVDSGSYTANGLQTQSNYIGAVFQDGAGATFYLNGSIDDVRLFNDALTASEVRGLFGSAYSNMDLSCKAINIADHDSDSTTTIFNWLKDDAPIAVLNMPFDSNVTSTTTDAVLDYSGNENDGTLRGASPTWSSSGIKGGAYTFNRTDDAIRVTGLNAGISAEATFAMWIKHTGDSATRTIYSYGTANDWYDVRLNSINVLYLWDDPDDDNVSLSTSYTITPNVWHYIVMTIKNSGSKEFFVDGVSVFEGSGSGKNMSAITTDSFDIGARNDGAYLFGGMIDEVRVYSTALSAEQIDQDYNNGKPLYNTIVNQETAEGDNSWQCKATVNDTYADSVANSSNIIDPSNSAPVQNFPSARAHALLDTSSAGYWQFEGGNLTSNILDETTNSNDGSCTNCPAWTAEGAIGGGYEFDGVLDKIEIPDNASLHFNSGPVSISTWIKPKSLSIPDAPEIFSKRDTGKTLHLRIGYVDEIEFQVVGTGGTMEANSANGVISENTWYHVVGVYDPTGSSQVYINGVASGNPVSFNAGDYDNTAVARIGIGFNSWEFNGILDEFHIYDRALTATEIANLYNSTSYVYGTMDLGVGARDMSDADSDDLFATVDWRESGTSMAVLNMSFNESVTSTVADAVADYSSYGNNGTLGGGTSAYAPTWTNAATCGNDSGGCYSFDGSNDFITMPSGAYNNFGTSDFTVEAWIKTSQAGAQTCIASIAGSANGWRFGYSNTLPYFLYGDGVHYHEGAIGSTALNDNNWHHLVMNYFHANQVVAYLDGVNVGSVSVSDVTDSANNGTVLWIGSTSGSSGFVNGLIDEVRIYNHILTAEQIASNYNAGKPNYQNIAYGETTIGETWKSLTTITEGNSESSVTLESNEVEILGFSTDVSDGGSSDTVPTSAGDDVTFTGIFNTSNDRDWYLAVCKTNAVTAGNNAAPTCDGGSWAISSEIADGASSSTATTPATYTTSGSDVEQNDWYAFACEKVASVASCSPMTQGSGDSGSPFVVNHAPSIGTVTIGPTCGSTTNIDPGNSASGTTIFDLGSTNDMAYAQAIQTDGKIVLAGRSTIGSDNTFALLRLNADGTADTSFGDNGKVITNVDVGAQDLANNLALQPDGKIVVVGQGGNSDYVVVRYTSAGVLDTSFDFDGIVTTDFGSTIDRAYAVAIQSDGKIVVGGYNSSYAFSLARYNTDGSLDTDFDTDGKVTLNFFNNQGQVQGLAIQDDGKIVAAGWAYGDGTNQDFALARFNPDGSLDSSFGSSGKVITAVTSDTDYGRDVLIDSNGNIVVGGSSKNTFTDFTIARYTPAGVLDTDFGCATPGTCSGIFISSVISGSDAGNAIAIQPDDKIWSAGHSNNLSLTLVRYNANGTFDTTFDGDGYKIYTIGSSSTVAYAIDVQGDGKVVASGFASTGSDLDFLTVRINPDGSFDDLSGYACVEADVTDSDTSNTVDIHVCSTGSFTDGTCDGTTYCTITGVSSGDSAQCVVDNLVPIPTTHGSHDVYVFAVDSNGLADAEASHTQSYSVTDTDPYVSNAVDYTTNSPVTLTAGGSTAYNFTVTVKDNNGDTDITGVTGVLYDSDEVELTSGTCTDDENDCYTDSSCTLSNNTSGTDTDADVQCDFNLWFNTNAGANWLAHVNPSDGVAIIDTPDSTTVTIGALAGIDIIDTGIAYGEIVIGGSSAVQTISLRNAGNQTNDFLLEGTDMCTDYPTCDGDKILKANQKWHIGSSTFDWDASATGDGPFPLVETPSITSGTTGCVNNDLRKRADHTSDNETNLEAYWKLRIPSGTPAGTYTGQVTFTTTNQCNAEICDNDTDDDGDGRIDCADHHDCDFHPSCTVATIPMRGVDHKTKPELLTDGNMENLGVGDWTVGSNATLTKETGSPHGGSQVIRIAYNGTANPYASQNIVTTGKTYHLTGWAKSDGTGYPLITTFGAAEWFGTQSTSWQSIDITFVADTGNLALFNNISGAGYVEFDDVSVTEVNALKDGDMEAVGTTAWTGINSAIVTKVTQTPQEGSQAIRVTRNGVTSAFIKPETDALTVDTAYRLTGYARSDGNAIPTITQGTGAVQNTVWTGGTSGSWEAFDFTFTATGTELRFVTQSATDPEYVEWDALQLQEINGTVDLSDNDLHAIFGDGTDLITFPIKLKKPAYYFDGVNDYMKVLDNDALDLTTAFTIAAWIRPASFTNDYQRILAKENTGGAYAIGTRTDGSFYAYINGVSLDTDPSDLTANTWHHVLVTYDQSNITLYVDGIQKLQSPYTTALSTNTLSLAIGARPNGSLYFNGAIADLKIFNSGFDSKQVRNLFFEQLSRFK